MKHIPVKLHARHFGILALKLEELFPLEDEDGHGAPARAPQVSFGEGHAAVAALIHGQRLHERIVQLCQGCSGARA